MLLLIRRFVLGAEAEGVFTLFAVVFFLMGVILFGIGLVGEYVGRIFQQVRGRPQYVVKTVLQQQVASARLTQHRQRYRCRYESRRICLSQRRRALPESAAGAWRGGRAGRQSRRQSGRNHLVRIGRRPVPGARHPLRDARRPERRRRYSHRYRRCSRT